MLNSRVFSTGVEMKKEKKQVIYLRVPSRTKKLLAAEAKNIGISVNAHASAILAVRLMPK
jgi:predicted HicB family RNase H-like nuclease